MTNYLGFEVGDRVRFLGRNNLPIHINRQAINRVGECIYSESGHRYPWLHIRVHPGAEGYITYIKPNGLLVALLDKLNISVRDRNNVEEFIIKVEGLGFTKVLTTSLDLMLRRVICD